MNASHIVRNSFGAAGGDVNALEAPFAASFPLPFRVLFLGAAGVLCWATNVHILHVSGVDVVAALDLQAFRPEHYRPDLPESSLRSSHSLLDPSILYKPIYKLFSAYLLWTLLGWTLFRFFTQDNLLLVDVYKYIPAIVSLVILMVLVIPVNVSYRRERDLFIMALRRCIYSPLRDPIFFSDVVLADILTSFAKVIGDVWLSLCMVMPGGSLLVFPSESRWLVPFLMSAPYLIRFRQCVFEYLHPQNTTQRPLYNALKYASSFPVIFLSAAQSTVSTGGTDEGRYSEEDYWFGQNKLFYLWLLAVAINSLYSFWWDVTYDWGFNLLLPASRSKLAYMAPALLRRQTPEAISSAVDDRLQPNGHRREALDFRMHQSSYPWGLRRTLLFTLPVYPLVIFINLILRLTWSIKLSSHLHSHASGAVIIFCIEVAELFRRWMWVFIRVEWEFVKKGETVREAVAHAERLELGTADEKDDSMPL